MIALKDDVLFFQLDDGTIVPLDATTITIQLVGETRIDVEVAQEAAAAVVRFFQIDCGRTVVTILEFSQALKAVLHGFDYEVEESLPAPTWKQTEMSFVDELQAPSSRVKNTRETVFKAFRFKKQSAPRKRGRFFLPSSTFLVTELGLDTICVFNMKGYTYLT